VLSATGLNPPSRRPVCYFSRGVGRFNGFMRLQCFSSQGRNPVAPYVSRYIAEPQAQCIPHASRNLKVPRRHVFAWVAAQVDIEIAIWRGSCFSVLRMGV
jgi:hypothetical protein